MFLSFDPPLPCENIPPATSSTPCNPGASIELDSLIKWSGVGGGAIVWNHQNRALERGASRVKAVLGLLIFIALVYLAVKLIPPYVNNYQLQDKMVEEARFAGVNRKDADSVREDVFKLVKDLEIPARKEDIHVEPIGVGNVRITLDYTVVVNVPGHEFHLEFHPQADSNSI